MSAIDYGILVGFMLWMLAIGAIYSRRMKNSADMFSAGGSSPWWVSGMSGFMTIFSAGTFVVWGGIAYRLGVVAVSILMVTGFSAALVGCTVAAKWHNTGIGTPSEFMRLRFNEAAVQVYTLLGTIFRGIGISVGLYALAVMLAVLVPLPEGAPFRDPTTGNLSVSWGIILWGAIVVTYTMAGGLWAVLMTDVIQCAILCLVVLAAVPLSLDAVGGIGNFCSKAPDGFFVPASAEYSFSFLGLWMFVGYFRYASDWAFVQRYICVPSAADAKKAIFLMAALYIASPIIWMLPAMAYRVLDPNAQPEEAYMLMCWHVLPKGMLGVMVAAMFSSTASTVSGHLNVFAAAFTCDVYRVHFFPDASDRHLLMVGRLSTTAYGALTICAALLVPFFGGAENVILTLITLLMGPMMLPPIWGLFSKRIGPKAIWITFIVCGLAAGLAKFGPVVHDNLPESQQRFTNAIIWTNDNPRLVEALIGTVLPLIVLGAIELASRKKKVDPGWTRLAEAFQQYECRPVICSYSRLPTQLISLSLAMLGVVMAFISIQAESQRGVLVLFTAVLLGTAIFLAWRSLRGGSDSRLT